jgi:hypothetical protein
VAALIREAALRPLPPVSVAREAHTDSVRACAPTAVPRARAQCTDPCAAGQCHAQAAAAETGAVSGGGTDGGRADAAAVAAAVAEAVAAAAVEWRAAVAAAEARAVAVGTRAAAAVADMQTAQLRAASLPAAPLPLPRGAWEYGREYAVLSDAPINVRADGSVEGANALIYRVRVNNELCVLKVAPLLTAPLPPPAAAPCRLRWRGVAIWPCGGGGCGRCK